MTEDDDDDDQGSASNRITGEIYQIIDIIMVI